jgi:hypothetical protein
MAKLKICYTFLITSPFSLFLTTDGLGQMFFQIRNLMRCWNEGIKIWQLKPEMTFPEFWNRKLKLGNTVSPRFTEGIGGYVQKK